MIYDFIVVGSGSGGGALSYYLNKSGAKVLLIEAGHFYRKDTFPKTEAETSALPNRPFPRFNNSRRSNCNLQHILLMVSFSPPIPV